MGLLADLMSKLYPNGGGVFGNQSSLPAWGTFRMGIRENPDGSPSTHLMRREYVPGKGWVVFPTLFQDADGKWIDKNKEHGEDWQPILKFAEEKGEVFNFGDDVKSAIDFADKGIWKSNQLIK
jgi:hypothetical protein